MKANKIYLERFKRPSKISKREKMEMKSLTETALSFLKSENCKNCGKKISRPQKIYGHYCSANCHDIAIEMFKSEYENNQTTSNL